ncbi:hypothetical protein KKA14_05885 [bacterium]|nr:hypothetical protein [bacterium]
MNTFILLRRCPFPRIPASSLLTFFFPFVSNLVNEKEGIFISIAFLPATLTQGLLPGWAFRRLKAESIL